MTVQIAVIKQEKNCICRPYYYSFKFSFKGSFSALYFYLNVYKLCVCVCVLLCGQQHKISYIKYCSMQNNSPQYVQILISEIWELVTYM